MDGVENLDNYASLLFELASDDRLNILSLLKKTPLKLSHISAKLDFTVQETSRNVTRLSDAKLITKDVDGAFHLTPYGEETLNLLSGFGFLFKNREYFTTHTLQLLPPQFRNSIGMLEHAEFVNDVMLTFHNVEMMIANAEEFIWILTDQVLASTIPYLVQAVQRGAEFHLLMQKTYNPTQSIRDIVNNPIFATTVRTGKLETKFLDKIDAFLCLSEREVAAIAFPNTQAKLDYTAFKSKNAHAIEWTKALYTHYWNQASSQLPDQLFQSNHPENQPK